MTKIFILVGSPGSGKTTWAKNYINNNPNTKHLSSDKIREEIFGSDTIQKDPWRIFAILDTRTINELANGNDVIYDATNINRKNRKNIIKQVRELESFGGEEIKIIAVDIHIPINVCIQRDKNRDRTVGEDVIKKYYSLYEPPSYEEDFDEIVEVN